MRASLNREVEFKVVCIEEGNYTEHTNLKYR